MIGPLLEGGYCGEHRHSRRRLNGVSLSEPHISEL